MIEIIVGLFTVFLLEPDEPQNHREEIVPMLINDESPDSDVNEDADYYFEF